MKVMEVRSTLQSEDPLRRSQSFRTHPGRQRILGDTREPLETGDEGGEVSGYRRRSRSVEANLYLNSTQQSTRQPVYPPSRPLAKGGRSVSRDRVVVEDEDTQTNPQHRSRRSSISAPPSAVPSPANARSSSQPEPRPVPKQTRPRAGRVLEDEDNKLPAASDRGRERTTAPTAQQTSEDRPVFHLLTKLQKRLSEAENVRQRVEASQNQSQQIAKLEERLSTTGRELEETQVKLKLAEQASEQLKAQAHSLRAQNQELHEKLQTAERSNKLLTGELTTMREQLEHGESTVRDLREKLKKQEECLARESKTSAQRQAQVDFLRRENSQLQHSIHSFNVEKQAFEEQMLQFQRKEQALGDAKEQEIKTTELALAQAIADAKRLDQDKAALLEERQQLIEKLTQEETQRTQLTEQKSCLEQQLAMSNSAHKLLEGKSVDSDAIEEKWKRDETLILSLMEKITTLERANKELVAALAQRTAPRRDVENVPPTSTVPVASTDKRKTSWAIGRRQAADEKEDGVVGVGQTGGGQLVGSPPATAAPDSSNTNVSAMAAPRVPLKQLSNRGLGAKLNLSNQQAHHF